MDVILMKDINELNKEIKACRKTLIATNDQNNTNKHKQNYKNYSLKKEHL